MVTLSGAKRYAWGNCNSRLGRHPQTISRQQERSGSAFFCWHTASVTTSPEQQGCGGRYPRRGASHPTFFINGRRLVGAQPLQSFVRVLQGELARSQ
jgi:hypothetical protein